MTSDGGPPSRYPPSMGPGARPIQPGDPQSQSRIAEVMKIRSSYSVASGPDALQLGYVLNGVPRSYRMPYDSIPMGGFARWWLYGDARSARATGVLTIDLIRGCENMLRRPLQQPEAEALTYYAGKMGLYAFWGPTSGMLIGSVLAYRTRHTMKFPFFPAKPLETYTRFPFQASPILTGASARLAWQAARFNVWTILCALFTWPLVSSMGSMSVAVGMARDPRTQTIVSQMKQQGADASRSIFNAPQERSSEDQYQPPPQGQDGGGQYGDPDNQAYFRDTDQSPVADREYNMAESGETGMLGDNVMRGRDNQRSSPRGGDHSSYQKPSSPTMRPESSKPSSEGEPFFYDDASPTAGNDPELATPTTYQPPGSAWERVRRGGALGPSRGQQSSSGREDDRRPQVAAAAGSSVTEREFSASRTSEREQAQREFDSMLDRERQQGGSDEYDRGMSAVESGQESQAGQGTSAWERRRRGE